MKKFILPVAVLAVMCFVAFFYFDLTSKNSLSIRVGVECGHAPYNWEEDKKSETNVPLTNKKGFFAEGYDVQMAKLIAKKIGAKIEFKHVHWDNLISALTQGEIDAIFSGMVDTDERKEVISFSVPYEVRKTEYSVLINRNSKYSYAQSIKELEGARIIAQKDSRFDQVIDQIPNVVHLPALKTSSAVVDEVLFLSADGAVMNYDTGLAYEKTYYKNLKVIRFSEDALYSKP